MLTAGNAVTLQSRPHTEGYFDYFSQLGTHLSCSFLDKLPNPKRKKKKPKPKNQTYIHPGQEQRVKRLGKITRRYFLTVRKKRDEAKDHGRQTAQGIIWNNTDDITFSLNV